MRKLAFLTTIELASTLCYSPNVTWCLGVKQIHGVLQDEGYQRFPHCSVGLVYNALPETEGTESWS